MLLLLNSSASEFVARKLGNDNLAPFKSKRNELSLPDLFG